MQKIDLSEIIKDAGLDEIALAKQLFPAHKHPYPALLRVLNGEGLLDSDQLFELATLVNCEVSELYNR